MLRTFNPPSVETLVYARQHRIGHVYVFSFFPHLSYCPFPATKPHECLWNSDTLLLLMYKTLEEICKGQKALLQCSNVALSYSPASLAVTLLCQPYLFSFYRHSAVLPFPVLRYSYLRWIDRYPHTEYLLLEGDFLDHMPGTPCAGDAASLCSAPSWHLSSYVTSLSL